jgi:hypothetical protein
MKKQKTCRSCHQKLSLTHFHRDASERDGLKTSCKECRNKADRDRYNSNHAPLKSEDFRAGVANGKIDPKASKDRAQLFNSQMADFSNALRTGAFDMGTFIGALGESEARFQNRRNARSVSLTAANERLHLSLIEHACKTYLRDKITPTGYATRKPSPKKRSVVALCSDWHIGARLSEDDNPMPFRALHESRSIEFFLRNILDFKPQYRSESECVLLLNGDMIEGMLGHDLRDGAPLVEQQLAFWHYMRPFVGLVAQQYPSVRVFCQVGNHGRNKLRHPGRAVSSKWDGYEYLLYKGLESMCSTLANVTFHIDKRAFSLVPLHGSTLLLTHGDTELALGDPDTQGNRNALNIDRALASGLYGKFDAVAVGHFHKARHVGRSPDMLFNGALVPPNGHARTSGYIGEPCSQWLWEAVEGFPIGDARRVIIGEAQRNDKRLGSLISEFVF